MATRIRLARGGTKKRPYYRIVAADKRAPRDGRFIEKLGTYNPLLEKSDPNRIILDKERITYWLGTGATPSEIVEKFLIAAKMLDPKKSKLIARIDKAKVKHAEIRKIKEKEEQAKKAEEEAAKKAEEAEAKAAEEIVSKEESNTAVEETPQEEATATPPAADEEKMAEASKEADTSQDETKTEDDADSKNA